MEPNVRSRVRGASINKIQKEMLLHYVEENPQLLSGRFSGTFTHKKARELWQSITDKLNAVPNGASKEWEQWRKTWQDLKKNAKGKAARIKKHMCGTGGGEKSQETLEDLDEQIINLMGPTVIAGHEEVAESLVGPLQQVRERASPVIITNNKENQVQSTQAVEHTYGAPYEDAIPGASCSRDGAFEQLEDDVEETVAPKINRKRVTKTRRLQSSLNISRNLVQISASKRDIDKDYYGDRLTLIQQEHTRRAKYEEQKLALLQANNAILTQVLAEVRALVSQMRNNQ